MTIRGLVFLVKTAFDILTDIFPNQDFEPLLKLFPNGIKWSEDDQQNIEKFSELCPMVHKPSGN